MTLFSTTWDHHDGPHDDDNEYHHTWKAFAIWTSTRWSMLCYKSFYDGMPNRHVQVGPLNISWGIYGEWR